ncbi:MAG: ribosome-associated translation inhibitor RaiA [Candidatus Omnitrophica bacterium]|nr:ribosome-associated translation inhibitor RaiA [Candidatus Omnitrophota bacterium]
MQITITGRHFDVTEPIKKHIMEKSERFSRYLKNIVNIHVILTVENVRHIAEIVMTAADTKFLSKEETMDMYASVDNAVDKIEHQLKEYKERHKSHRTKLKEEGLESDDLRVDDAPVIVKDTRFLDKPMSPEEAIMELELEEFGFFVFKDMNEGDKVKIIYKKKDKSYGLIDT